MPEREGSPTKCVWCCFGWIASQVFIRHGDRSPVDDTKCWNDDNAVWSCTLSQNEKNSVTMNSTVAVDRMYDLAFIPNREALPGSCGLGQLTTIGQSQQLQNGEVLPTLRCVLWRALWRVYDAGMRVVAVNQNLRKAYVDSGVLPADYFGNEDKFFLRSDNSQRTIQSGQALFTGMYPPAGNGTTEEVAWNVMDMSACGVRFDEPTSIVPCVYLTHVCMQPTTQWVGTKCCALR